MFSKHLHSCLKHKTAQIQERSMLYAMDRTMQFYNRQRDEKKNL